MGNSVMLNGIEYAGEQIAYKDSTYELVSKVAYLIGVPLRIFQNEHEPPKIEIYNRLEQDKNARIIRNLCIIRTAIERNYRKINDIMRMEYRGLLSMPEIIPASSMQQLSSDGINFIKKSSTKLCHHIIEINRLISDRINNCKSLFPIWINWAYIKELFIMPNGFTEDGTKDAADIYYASLSYYPYQMYINWVPMDEGKFKGLSLKDKTTEETAGADVTSFRFNLSDGTSYDLIYACYGVKNGELKSAAGGFKYFTSADIGSYWNNLNTELEAIPINESELP